MSERPFAEIRLMSKADIPGAAALQRACFPPPFPEGLLWRPEHLARHLEIFPEGQWVAVTPPPLSQREQGEEAVVDFGERSEHGGGVGEEGSGAPPLFLQSENEGGVGEGDYVLASASSLILSEENWQAHLDWETTVGGFFFEAHDPGGTTLFGADISVRPDWRRQGLGKALYRARFDLVRRLGLARFGTACRIPDYAAWKNSFMGAPRAYVDEVVSERLDDRTLSPLLRSGLRCVGVIENHMDDVESGNAAALLEWTP